MTRQPPCRTKGRSRAPPPSSEGKHGKPNRAVSCGSGCIRSPSLGRRPGRESRIARSWVPSQSSSACRTPPAAHTSFAHSGAGSSVAIAHASLAIRLLVWAQEHKNTPKRKQRKHTDQLPIEVPSEYGLESSQLVGVFRRNPKRVTKPGWRSPRRPWAERRQSRILHGPFALPY